MDNMSAQDFSISSKCVFNMNASLPAKNRTGIFLETQSEKPWQNEQKYLLAANQFPGLQKEKKKKKGTPAFYAKMHFNLSSILVFACRQQRALMFALLESKVLINTLEVLEASSNTTCFYWPIKTTDANATTTTTRVLLMLACSFYKKYQFTFFTSHWTSAFHFLCHRTGLAALCTLGHQHPTKIMVRSFSFLENPFLALALGLV